MAIVRIPDTANPFRVMINGVQYSYEAGAVLDVPDAVAAVIGQHNSALDHMEDTAPDAQDRVLELLVQLDMLPAVLAGDRLLADEKKNVILRY